ncbi:MAG: YihA family ribosome biogenesis GTP-binding protein [Bacteroidetes bacterium]|nr:YihA family ribosome biogenesis GTP-binding protein [Bacteroidota bacterium]
MKILSSEYIKSSAKLSQCPKPEMPEFAFIGRSNVGKSSLINMIVNKQGLAKTSSKQGKTVTINHFLINKKFYLVDLPGYGYAARSIKMREEWERNLWEYIMKRESLKYLFVLIDTRIPPQKIDIDFINKCGERGVPIVIAFTKTDKEKESRIKKNINEFCAELLKYWDELPVMIETSSLNKKGKPEILKFLADNL